MSFLKNLLSNLPEVKGPTQKRLSFKEKLIWTLVALLLFFVMGVIPLYGLGSNALAQFQYLSIILGAEFGSIISLGIGPIVTASIVLQLLNGSGILKFNLTTPEGKKNFQGIQKLLSIVFILLEAGIYVYMGGLAPFEQYRGTGLYSTLQLLLVFQLFLGGLLIMFFDEVVSKWGFGSGISLFIVAGVSKSVFIRAFNWLPDPATGSGEFSYLSGKVPQFFQALFRGDPQTALLAISAILATVIIFAIAVYAQAMKVEIPLAFGRVRGYGIRWPLSFIYTSNIPVILVSALLANLQLWGTLLNRWAINSGNSFLMALSNFFGSGTGGASTGLIGWVSIPGGQNGLLGSVIEQGTLFIGLRPYLQAMVYLGVLIVGCVVFSYFWVQTSGMDAQSQAKQMVSSGLLIPGFRKDPRIMEQILERYITPLTIMGAIVIGFLAGVADLLGALSNGTSILLSVMIVYRLYEDIAKQHMMDMHPMVRRFME